MFGLTLVFAGWSVVTAITLSNLDLPLLDPDLLNITWTDELPGGISLEQDSNSSQSNNTLGFTHHCDNVTCEFTNLNMCPELFTCECQPNWDGPFCSLECTLPCVNGHCKIDVNVTQTGAWQADGESYCNCKSNWHGELCDTFTENGQDDKRIRIMAGVLAASLAFAVLAVFVIALVLWRRRVVFVLKLVYYLKRYDDYDDKLYDVYVSMTSTSNAEKFVYGELKPKLENLGFTLYLNARDCPVGEVLSESILDAVEKSRCTIIIITPDYISSEWSRFEYLIAQHETLKLKQRIIPIILEQVDKTNMDKALKHIVDSVKCLKHPLMKALSLPENSPKNTFDNVGFTNEDGSTRNIYEDIVDSDKFNNQKKYEKAEAKFWQRLELTLPKKRKIDVEADVESHIYSNHNLNNNFNSKGLIAKKSEMSRL